MAGVLKSDRRFVCGVDQIAKYPRNYGWVNRSHWQEERHPYLPWLIPLVFSYCI
ncbi:hypothetical protein [Microcystis panniformis]|uniref:Uncharacterized protein n=1 Tax=Microcystis panniformis FACHB-1757 TaxID=1638788 RepID=A0A0K1SAS6_9CHRO|nr:hypothetical protein [Microcystis panniformis]AKV71150.1 hypothetical protein VL20_6416 [Microcystis panniformis FACHB-1757]